jgi:hypothetical protein
MPRTNDEKRFPFCAAFFVMHDRRLIVAFDAAADRATAGCR